MATQRSLARLAPKLLRDLAVLAGGQFVSKLIGIAAFGFLARRLDPQGYGAVEYVVGLAGFFSLAIDCGLGTVGVRRIAAAPSERAAVAAQVPLLRLFIAACAVPLMIAVVAMFGPPAVPLSLAWLFALSLVFAAWNQDWLLQSAELMSKVAVAQTLRVLVFAAVVLVLVGGPGDVALVGWAEMAAAFAMAGCLMLAQHRHVTAVRLTASFRQMKALARDGISVGLSQFVWSAAQYLPLFWVASQTGTADAGWFGAAQRLVASIATFGFVYHFNLYPAFARAFAAGGPALRHLMEISYRVTAWGSIGLALALTLAAAPVLQAIYGAKFVESAPSFAILVWTVPMMILSGHARWALIVSGAARGVFYAQSAGLAVVAALGLPLIAVDGITGAAVTAVAGNIAVWSTSHLLAARAGVRPPSVALFVRPAALALAIFAAAHALQWDHGLEAVLGFIVYAAVAPLMDHSLLRDLARLAHAKAPLPPS